LRDLEYSHARATRISQHEGVAVTASRSSGVDQNAETAGVEQRHARQVDHHLSTQTFAMAAQLDGGELATKCR
jgi:hypothetical protein